VIRTYSTCSVGEAGYVKDFELAHLSIFERTLTDEEIGYLLAELEIE
jgi:hypothetical protein